MRISDWSSDVCSSDLKCWKTGASRQSCNEPALHAKGKPRRFHGGAPLRTNSVKGLALISCSIFRSTGQHTNASFFPLVPRPSYVFFEQIDTPLTALRPCISQHSSKRPLSTSKKRSEGQEG